MNDGKRTEIVVSKAISKEREGNLELHDLVAVLMKRENRVALESYASNATKADSLKVSILNHLMTLVSFIQIRDAQPGDILKGMMSGFYRTDDVMADPLLTAVQEISSKTRAQEADEIIAIPQFWIDSNNLFAEKIIARMKKNKNTDAIGVNFSTSDGQEKTYLFWTRDNVVRYPLIFDFTQVQLA